MNYSPLAAIRTNSSFSSPDWAYRQPAVTAVSVRGVELVALEVHTVRVAPIVGRGRPIVPVAAHIIDSRAVAAGSGRQEHRTGILHLRPLGRGVAVA